MTDKFPAFIYLVRSRANPEFAIACTELHLAKWIDHLMDNGQEPEVQAVSRAELVFMMQRPKLFKGIRHETN
jgi:hypothetical protein